MKTLPETVQNHNEIIVFNKCHHQLQTSRKIAVYRSLIDIIGDFNTAVYLSQFIYWNRKGTLLVENNGFVYKSVADIFEETGLTLKMQARCRNILKEFDFIEIKQEKVFGKGAKLSIKLNDKAIYSQLGEYYNIDPNIQEITPENWKVGNHPVLQRFFDDRIAYHRDLVYLLEDIPAAFILSYILNRCAVERKFYKSLTIADWTRISKLTHHTQSSSRQLLKNLELIEEQKPIPFNSRIFTFPQFDKILEKLERLSEYKESSQRLQKWKFGYKSPKWNESNSTEQPQTETRNDLRLADECVDSDTENNNSLKNNELLLNNPKRKLGDDLNSTEQPKTETRNDLRLADKCVDSDTENNSSLKNNELLLNNPKWKLGDDLNSTEQPQTETRNDLHPTEQTRTETPSNPERKLSFKEITGFKDYTNNNTPLNPPINISVSFGGGGGGVSSSCDFSAEENKSCLKGNEQKSQAEQKTRQPETQANKPQVAKNPSIDWDSLQYPNCFYAETQNDPQQQQALKDNLRHIVASTIPAATQAEIQELLDEMNRGAVRSVRNYFAKLCQNKARGLFFPTLASIIKQHRNDLAKSAHLQQQVAEQTAANEQQRQQEQQIQQESQNYSDHIEQLVFRTAEKTILRQKLKDEYKKYAAEIETQLNANFFSYANVHNIRIRLEKIAAVLIAYAYQFKTVITQVTDLRKKIIQKIGEEKLQQDSNYQQLWEILNMPEMQGKLSEDLQQTLKQG